MPDPKKPSLATTERVSESDILQAQRVGSLHHDRAVSLVLYSRDGVRIIPLAEGRGLVVGRFPPADIPVRDPSLSRQHASFELDGETVWVEDLDSTNGTWVNGSRVERCELRPGDSVTLGTLAGTVLAVRPDERVRFGVASHDVFLRELALEIERARTFKRVATVLMVKPAGQQPPALQRWVQVQNRLRPFDRVGLYSRDTLEVLLPEVNADAARAAAGGLLELLQDHVVATATYPDHAGSAEELLEVARDMLRSATSGLTQPAPASRSVRPSPGENGPVIVSAETRRLHDMAQRLASSSIPVLLLGETGVGKEVVARTIHDAGVRKSQPMVCVNCGSVPAQLVESTLFGHAKGAFTGANVQAKGVFETAHGGTVLLDEIGELPLPAQAALLRVLETKRFARVGSHTEIEVDVRVVAATHRNLEEMADEGSFRRDLLYRLNAMTLSIPPLRQRRDEIEPLALRFLEVANRANGRNVLKIAPEAVEVLRRYGWPGNVRELRNAIERAVVIAHGDEVSVDDLPEGIRQLASDSELRPALRKSNPAGGELAGEINLRTELQRHEAELIVRALDATDWQRAEAAELLGLPLRTLAHRMKLLGIRRNS